jgi:hypothetical protein
MSKSGMAASVYSRTLQKAAELLGSRAKLCRALQVPAAELQKWIDDKAAPPLGIFLRAVDLIIDETPPPAAGSGSGSGPGEPPAPREAAPPGDASRTRY